MNSILWATDLHLDFLQTEKASKSFGQYLNNEHPDVNGLIVTGDIASGLCVYNSLLELAVGFTKPIYFVLGNHDYYNSSFKEVRKEIDKVHEQNSNLHWINNKFIHLSDEVVLVGCDGWYDTRNGFGLNSNMLLNDFVYIEDLKVCLKSKSYCEIIIKAIADKYARDLTETLNSIRNVSKIIIATHVPPYIEACWHEGKISDDNALPWFSNRIIGEAIDKYSNDNPDVNIIVLTGHTHSQGEYCRNKNITVYTGKAIYGIPDICGVVELDSFSVKLVGA